MNRVSQTVVLRVSMLVIASSVLASCITAGPDYQRPVLALPSDWQQAHTGDASLLDAQVRSSTARVSLQEGFALFADEQLLSLQSRALDNSPDLQSAMLRFAQSRTQLDGVSQQNQAMLRSSAGAARVAQSASGSATRLISAISSPEQSDSLIDFIAEPFALYHIGFDASWELDLWGGVQRRIESAQADVDLSVAMTEQVQLALLSEIARHYFTLRAAQQQLLLLDQDILRAEQLLGLLQVRTEAGLSNELDSLQQEAMLAQARAQRPGLLAQEAQSLNAIGLLLGEGPGSLQTLLAEDRTWQLTAIPDLALGLPSDLVNTRPDIQAAEAQLRAASAQVGAAKARLYPSIILGAGLGLESLNSGELADWGARQWSLGPQIDLPLFDQGQRKTLVRLRELRAQEAAINFQQVVLKAWHEVDTALTAYSAQRQSHQQLQAQLASQTQVLEHARTHFNNGVINYLQVLAAEQGVAQASRALSVSEAEMAIRIVALFKTLGRSDALNANAVAER